MPASELGAELVELVRPAARELGGEGCSRASTPRRCEADLQLSAESAEDAAAGLVARSVA